jgi:hypothetical protein
MASQCAMASNNSAATASSIISGNVGILQSIVEHVGLGEALFVSTISKAFLQRYRTLHNVSRTPEWYERGICPYKVLLTPQTTAYSAVFASPSRVKLAAACGLAFQVSEAEMDSGVLETRTRCLQHRAGKFADEATLTAAAELGLPLDSTCIATGAAESGDLAKLQMLHRKHACKLDCTVRYAARSGSIEMLLWLKQQGRNLKVYNHTTNLGDEAAAAGHLNTLKFLHIEGAYYYLIRLPKASLLAILWQCKLRHSLSLTTTATFIITYNSLFYLCNCLHLSGCPASATYAAVSGNVEIVKFLVEEGVVRTNTAVTIHTAALFGRLSVCQYLRTLGCPWARLTSKFAAKSGNLATLRWLIENGCPWDPHSLALQTARSGSIECMEYIRDTSGVALGVNVLTEMLNAAGCEGKLAAVQWLRQAGADWPDEVGMYPCTTT